jgi:hypothetical protein
MFSRFARDAGQRSAVAAHLVKELVGRTLLRSRQIELRLIVREAHVEHFPIPRGERARVAAFERHGVQVRIAGTLRLKVNLAIVLHPAQGVGAGPSDPGVVAIVRQFAGFAGGGVERENPAVLEVGRTAGDHGFGAVVGPDRHAQLKIAILRRGRARGRHRFRFVAMRDCSRRRAGGALAVIHPRHLAGFGIENGDAGGRLAVPHVGAPIDVFHVAGIGNVVRHHGRLGGSGLPHSGENVLLVGRKLQLADSLRPGEIERFALRRQGLALRFGFVLSGDALAHRLD